MHSPLRQWLSAALGRQKSAMQPTRAVQKSQVLQRSSPQCCTGHTGSHHEAHSRELAGGGGGGSRVLVQKS